MFAKEISWLSFQNDTFFLPNMSCNKFTEFYLTQIAQR